MIRRLVLAWSLMLALLSQSLAQDAPPSPPAITNTTVLLDLGYAGHLPAGDWAPVTVVVSATEQPIEAVARIRVSMPDGGSITSLVPVDTTPGRETTVDTTLWIPPVIQAVTVDLMAEGRGTIASASYGSFAGGGAIQLPMPSAMPIILGVGSSSLRLAFGVENYQREFFGPSAETMRRQASIARIASAVPRSPGAPIRLPSTAAAYDGLTAVIVDGQLATRLEPDGVTALREWTISGGRLMLVNADSTAMRHLLGEHAPPGLRVRPPAENHLPALLGGPGTVLARTIDASSLPAGWAAVPETQGLAVEGPIGLGWAMLLGFDPDTLADDELIEATEIAWHATLGLMVEDELQEGLQRLDGDSWNPSSLEVLASRMAMAWVSRAPIVGMGAFVAIFAMMVALAFLIGPVDRLVLKRLGSLHRWWLAALAWISLATIGALIAPRAVRSGPTTVSSIRVVDALDAPDQPVRAWQSTIDGMFLNRPARIPLDDIDEGAWLAPMLDPWQVRGVGTLVMSPRGRTMKARPTTGRLWTTRTFQQHGPTTPPLLASVELDGGEYAVRLQGVGAERARLVAVHTSGRWLHLMPGSQPSRDGQSLIFRAVRADLVDHPHRVLDVRALQHEDDFYMYNYEGVKPKAGIAVELDGPSDRSKALEALGDSEQWAVVYVQWDDEQPVLGATVGEEFSTMWVCRMAVPVSRIAASAGGSP